MSQGQAVSRRRLGSELKRLRDEAGLTLEQAASALECSASKISRLETGKGLPKQRDVRDLARLYGKEAERSLERLLRLAKEGARAGWWQEYTHLLASDPFVFDGADRYAALEAGATSIRTFDHSALPGLLQTEAYARAILDIMLPAHSPEEIAKLVEFRMRRQSVLTRAELPLRVDAIVDESVLLRMRALEVQVRAEQVDQLIQRMRLPNVDLLVLPLSAGFVRAALGNFVVLEFEESQDQDAIFVENHAGNSYLEGDFGVEKFKSIYDEARERTLGPVESVDYIRDVIGG
jgi:transcriptional regulator with XRE-family HTH domain